MENENDFYEERLKKCKACPLYKTTNDQRKAICNPKLYLNLDDKKTTSNYPKIGFRAGCGCVLSKRLANPNSKCVCGVW